MATSSHIGPGSWRIVLEATEARLTTSRRKGPRLLYAPPRLDGAFYLRPNAALAGFALQLPLPSHRAEPPVLHWESAELDRDAHAWLRFGRQAVRSPVSVVCAEIPGERPYVKIVLETVFSSGSLRLPVWFPPRPVTLRLFSEIRPTDRSPG
ncbi:hypothetical protein FHU36_003727 [Nonomuraea muscovyensis]|uniref:Uncharacterized protein n=1 Tax=Nonomuraea muscovyensis TaxID=1124761 RepID=A0A7X0C2J5_9ACTN|nr:hypothetical protein [Nonomuraea muscovyensis]MBB6347182.1 hypothetical protein [Nonomuraea muscovyensis]